jgi:putative hemolysin
MHLHNLSDLFVGVNKHGKNDQSVRQQIMELFESNEAVCIFPAGLVSRKINGEIRDLDWKKTFVTYAAKYDQAVIPVYIDGQLSPFFYRLSRLRKFLGIKLNLEMLYLSDELFKQRNKTIRFVIGKPLYIKDLPNISEKEQAQLVKAKVYELAVEKR